MQHYEEIKTDVFGHENIFKKILDFLSECTIPRTIDGSRAYLESCYISKRLFTRLSSGSKKLSEKELVWLPTTRIGVYQLIYTIEPRSDGEYYKISLIADGGDVTHFASVSGTSFFFMDDGERSSIKK